MSRRLTRIASSSSNCSKSSPREVSIHVMPKQVSSSPDVIMDTNSSNPVHRPSHRRHSPEQRLCLVALRLAVLEKVATAVGKLAFVWATVVLLGGYVTNLEPKDFWIIAVLLLTEGTRVFSRSSELDWQQANYSFSIINVTSLLFDRSKRTMSRVIHSPDHNEEPSKNTKPVNKPAKSIYQSFGAKRTWSWAALPLVPYFRFISAKTIAISLYFLQLASAGVTIGLSLYRLIRYDEFDIESRDSPSPEPTTPNNAAAAVTLFYSMMLGEAALFLLERGYWEYKIRFKKLLEEVNRKCELEQDDLETMKQYYYAVYSRCLNGSVFDGLELDLITFTAQKIQSSIREEQLGSVQILLALVSKGVAREETRRRIGTTPGVIERLIEMACWKELNDREIRKAATLVIRNLVRHHDSNSFKISAIPGSLEGLTSLLLDKEQKVEALTILKHLGTDHRTCVRIGNTSGLVSTLISFLGHENWDINKPTTLKIFKKSLQLLNMMANAGGESGHLLRNKIAAMVFAVRNLNEILELKDAPSELKVLVVDILTSLANEDEIRERIGATGGVIRSLLGLFTKITTAGSVEHNLSMKAGEAIGLLVFQSPKNCSRMLNHKPYKEREPGVSQTLKDLIGMLNSRHICIHAATILRSLCNNLNDKEKKELGTALPRVIEMVLELKDTEQEAAVGLAAAIIPFADNRSLDHRTLLINKTIELLSAPMPSPFSRTRRYSVEFLDALLMKDKSFLKAFRKEDIVESSLERMLETASDVENFYTFSGTVGATRHSHTLEELVNSALAHLHTL